MFTVQLTIFVMLTNVSSVPFSEELRALAKFIADEFNGGSILAVDSIPENVLCRASDESNAMVFSIFLFILLSSEIITPESPCHEVCVSFSKFRF